MIERATIPFLAFLLSALAAASADLIHLTDGRTLHGTLGEERADEVQIRLKQGSVWVKRAEVRSVETLSDLREQYARQRAALGAKDAAGHFALAGWCVECDLNDEARAEWEATVAADPAHEAAHKALGHVEVDGRWMPPEEARLKLGLVERDGAWVTPVRARVLELVDHYLVADAGGRELVVAELRALGDEPVRDLAAWLRESTEALRRDLQGGNPERLTRTLRDRFREQRSSLLSLVFDERRYPDDNAAPEVMQRVAVLFRSTEALATDPASFVLSETAAREAAIRRIEAGSSLGLAVLPEGASEPALLAGLLDPLRAGVTAEGVTGGKDLNPFGAENASLETANAETAKALSLAADDAAVLAEVNRYRARLGLRILRLDARLEEAARKHSAEMESLGYFSHVSPTRENRTLKQRIRAAKFDGDLVGENIAEGDFSPAEIVEAWRVSPGHHRNLLRASLTAVGVSRVGTHWTLDLGGWEPRRGRQR